jgi:hypothetical protein
MPDGDQDDANVSGKHPFRKRHCFDESGPDLVELARRQFRTGKDDDEGDV